MYLSLSTDRSGVDKMGVGSDKMGVGRYGRERPGSVIHLGFCLVRG